MDTRTCQDFGTPKSNHPPLTKIPVNSPHFPHRTHRKGPQRLRLKTEEQQWAKASPSCNRDMWDKTEPQRTWRRLMQQRRKVPDSKRLAQKNSLPSSPQIKHKISTDHSHCTGLRWFDKALGRDVARLMEKKDYFLEMPCRKNPEHSDMAQLC